MQPERDKGRVDTARQRQQTLFEERAHTAALNRLDLASCRNCVTRREPWKLPSASSSNTGVKPIANANRIVPAVGGEARALQTRSPTHVEPVAAVAAQLGVDVGPLVVQYNTIASTSFRFSNTHVH